jgi:transposase
MNFLACDREQAFLMPPDPRDWLPEGHLAWFLLASVEEMDLDAFYGSYRQDGWGRAAFEPSMMVSLLLYAYARGERSSRGIERKCVEDVAYRMIAIDGTKLHANASHHCNLDYEQLAREILKEAGDCGACEARAIGEADVGTPLAAAADPCGDAAEAHPDRRNGARGVSRVGAGASGSDVLGEERERSRSRVSCRRYPVGGARVVEEGVRPPSYSLRLLCLLRPHPPATATNTDRPLATARPARPQRL